MVGCERLCDTVRIQGLFIMSLHLSRELSCYYQPVDFTVLKPQTRDFLSYFFCQLFTSSQTSIPTLQSDVPPTRNKASLEEIFVKAARIQALAMGLVYFLTEMKKGSEEVFIRWAIGVAIDALRTGLDIVPAL
jgi:nucleolar MIF4G domain-containing protein 1